MNETIELKNFAENLPNKLEESAINSLLDKAQMASPLVTGATISGKTMTVNFKKGVTEKDKKEFLAKLGK